MINYKEIAKKAIDDTGYTLASHWMEWDLLNDHAEKLMIKELGMDMDEFYYLLEDGDRDLLDRQMMIRDELWDIREEWRNS